MPLVRNRKDSDLSLEMKEQCERCEGKLEWSDEVYICSFECSYCPDCAEKMFHTCLNCGGELVIRPKREAASEAP